MGARGFHKGVFRGGVRRIWFKSRSKGTSAKPMTHLVFDKGDQGRNPYTGKNVARPQLTSSGRNE